jgi:hypothetical protein
VCCKPLSKRTIAAIVATGDNACPVCGVVMFVCYACQRFRPDDADAMALHFSAHCEECAQLAAEQAQNDDLVPDAHDEFMEEVD